MYTKKLVLLSPKNTAFVIALKPTAVFFLYEKPITGCSKEQNHFFLTWLIFVHFLLIFRAINVVVVIIAVVVEVAKLSSYSL